MRPEFLLSVLKFFRGYVQVRLTGRRPERFLNLLAHRNILIWNLSPCQDADGFDFCISKKGYEASGELLERTGTALEVKKRRGLPFFLYRYRARKLFAIGFVLAVLLLWFLSGYIWKIQVNGTESLSPDMIRTWLTEQGQSFGTKKRDVDTDEIEAGLRRDFSAIAWTSAKLSGTKLTIDIKERLPEDADDSVPQSGSWDLVASEAAVITGIYTRSGTPMVQAGDVVSQGAVLILGQVDLYDDNGEVSDTWEVIPDGDVTGTVTKSYEETLPVTYEKKVYQGKAKKSYTLCIGGFRLPLPLSGAEDGTYELTSRDYQLQILPDIYLPLHLLVSTRQPYEYETGSYSRKEAKELLSKEWNGFLKNFTEKGIPITVKNVRIEKNEENYVLRGTLEAEISLSKYKER
jgi:similar to stage IV sporulation protein